MRDDTEHENDDDMYEVWIECQGRCRMLCYCCAAWIIALGIAAWGIHKYWVG